MNSRDVIGAIEAAGWVHVATKGDHRQFKHPSHPKRDFPIGTLRSIEKQSGVRLR